MCLLIISSGVGGDQPVCWIPLRTPQLMGCVRKKEKTLCTVQIAMIISERSTSRAAICQHQSSLLKQFKLTEIQSRPHCNMTKCIHLDIYVLLSIKRFSVIFNENNNRKAKITIFRASNNEVTSPAVTRLRLYVACESVSLFLS